MDGAPIEETSPALLVKRLLDKIAEWQTTLAQYGEQDHALWQQWI
jgi:hypothetical protein